MGKLRQAAIVVMSLFFMAGCTYKTAGEAIQNDIPFNIKQIVHKEKVDGGWLVFYTTEQKDGGKKVDALAVAYLNGSKENGWKNVGHNHWIHYKNDYMIVYADVFHTYHENGKLDKRIPVLFGEVLNPEIKKIEAMEPKGTYKELTITNKNQQRFFYAVGDYTGVRALDADGKELDLQGDKK